MVPCSICTLDDENAAVSRLRRESASTGDDRTTDSNFASYACCRHLSVKLSKQIP
jgi:hypothetical protein